MELLIFLSCVSLSVAQNVARNLMGRYYNFNTDFCVEETAELKKIYDADQDEFWDLYDERNSPQFMKFDRCSLRHQKLMDNDGNLVTEMIKKNLMSIPNNMLPEIADIIVKQCAVEKTTPEETAYHFLECRKDLRSSFDNMCRSKQMPFGNMYGWYGNGWMPPRPLPQYQLYML